MRRLIAVLLCALGTAGATAADLQLQVEVLPGALLLVGEPVTLRYTLTNLGPDASPSSIVGVTWRRLPLPAAVTCTHAFAVPRPEGEPGVTWLNLFFGDTPVGVSESCDVVLAGLPVAGIYPIPARTYSQIVDPNPANNTADVELQVLLPATPIPALESRATALLGLLMLVVAAVVLRRGMTSIG